jgi:hypothetical protein
MESLRRPAVYNGVTYPDYEMDFYTSDVYRVGLGKGATLGRVLKPNLNGKGYLAHHLQGKGYDKRIKQHRLLAETFPDLIRLSPIVSHHGLKIGKERHELEFGTAFRMICNMVCTDHIDSNKANNHHSNLMIVTQFENILKCGPTKRRKYKGLRKRPSGAYQMRIGFPNILDKNGKSFYPCKTFKTEEEAVLAYNTTLEESLLTIFGLDLGPKLYDLAYKNEVPATVQQELFV